MKFRYFTVPILQLARERFQVGFSLPTDMHSLIELKKYTVRLPVTPIQLRRELQHRVIMSNGRHGARNVQSALSDFQSLLYNSVVNYCTQLSRPTVVTVPVVYENHLGTH